MYNQQNIRLSRITHPRGNLAAVILLIVVFLGFGVVAEACLPDAEAGTIAAEETLQTERTFHATSEVPAANK